LSGGDPQIIDRISKMGCEKDSIPPGLQTPADCSEPVISLYPVQINPILVKEFPDGLYFFIEKFEHIIAKSLTEGDAFSLIKSLGLTNSSRISSLQTLTNIFWAMVEIEKEIIDKKIPKSKVLLIKRAGDIRIRGRASMNVPELRKRINEVHKMMIAWCSDYIDGIERN